MNLESFESLLEVESLPLLQEQALLITKKIGFDHYLYGLQINLSLTRPLRFIFSSYPAEWRTRYDEQDYIKVDPTVKHCLQHVIPYIWKDSDLTKEGNAFIEEARVFGLYSGVSVPIRGHVGEAAMLSLAFDIAPSKAKESILLNLGTAHLFACYLHEAVRSLIFDDMLPIKSPHLTPREKECFKWAAEGKTAWEIANIMNLSERTIVFHLSNATKKMSAANQRQAIVRAISLGLITP